MLDAILSWQTFLVALLVFGFAPGALLRVIVRAFPHVDPRREELLAELHAVPRFERPFWVLEQLEVAVAEGLWGRIVWAATGRIVYRWRTESAEKLNRAHPDTFEIPPVALRHGLEPGMSAKLLFLMNDGWGERMWVDVAKVTRRGYVGVLCNQPVGIPRLSAGDKIKFTPDQVLDVDVY